MRITILTAGSRGDTEPYLALGIALKQAGHTVRLAASEGFEDYVTSHGLVYHPVEGNFRSILAGEAGQITQAGRTNMLWTARTLNRMVGPILEQMGQAMIEASRDAEAIISALPVLAFDVAQGLGVRYIPASLFPFARTGAFAHPFLPPTLPRWFWRTSFTWSGRLVWLMFGRTINRIRREKLGMPPWGFGGSYEHELKAGFPTLYGFSPHLIPPPADWPANIHVTGYWFLDPPAWEPPADLVDFLEAGPPPVFIGFGSMPDADPDQTTAILVEALKLSGQRGLLLRGWGGLGQAALPETIFKLEFAPYGWLLPRTAMVIHHGGTGTTHSALRAGVPSIVVPFFGDQHFWGDRVYRLGVGPAPIPRSRLTAERLAAAIRAGVGDASMCERAAETGAKIRAEQGLARAVEIVEQSLKETQP